MKRSTDRILTTHTGSLPRPAELRALLTAQEAGTPPDRAVLDDAVRTAVGQVVKQQVAAGLDVVNDGEQGKPGYATYIKDRVTGFGGQSKVTTVWDGGAGLPRVLGARHGQHALGVLATGVRRADRLEGLRRGSARRRDPGRGRRRDPGHRDVHERGVPRCRVGSFLPNEHYGSRRGVPRRDRAT